MQIFDILKKHIKYYVAGSVALMTFLVYLAALQNDFVEWDDNEYVFENPFIKAFDLSFFKWAFFDFYTSNWHPLTWISHAFDYAIWGLNPLGHHLTNNVLHALNTFLVVLLVVRLIESTNPGAPVPSSKSRFTLFAAAVTGLLFGLHPIHVESVAWASERKDLLCALFYLLSIMAYMSYRSNKTYRTYLLTLAFFILALSSKPMAVSLPIVLLILDWYPFGRITSFRTFSPSFTEKLPFFALSIAASILTVLAHKTGAIKSVEAIPLSSRVLVAAKSLIAYLWKMLAPINLSPYYPYPKNIDLLSLDYLLPVILVTSITAVSLVFAKKQKLLLSSWGYYFLTLVPVIGIVQVGDQSMADRYTYLPSLGPFLMIGLLAAWSLGRTHRLMPVMKYAVVAPVVILLLYLSFLTTKQIEVWKDTFSLWTYVIEKEPQKVPVAYNNRGLNFGKAGLMEKAIEDFTMTLKIDPKYAKSYNNRGYTYHLTGQNAKALDDLNKAIDLDNNFVKAYENRGTLYLETGNKVRAISDFQKACDLGHKEACDAVRNAAPPR